MIRKKQIVLTPAGTAGSAADTYRLALSRPAIIRFIGVDYTSQPVTTDVVVKADTSAGLTLFTKSNNGTDINPTAVATAGMDEGGAATAATDVGSGGFAVTNGIYVSVAQGDPVANGVVVNLWIEQ